MQVHTGFRYRLEPAPDQRRRMAQYAGACRWVWNEALAWRGEAFFAARAAGGRPAAGALGYVALAARLTLLRGDIAWLGDAPIHPLQQTLRDQDTAFTRYFEGKAEYPRFKPKGRGSFRFPDPKQFALEGEWLKLPKLGWVRLRLSRGLPACGRILNITVSREGGHWFASLCVEHEIAVTAAPVGPAVGVDLGVANSLVLSTGERIHLPVPTEIDAAGLARLHRQVSRKRKGSGRWRRAVERLAKRKRHLSARRRDAAHKATTRIAKMHSLVVVEDLHLRAMSASAKGSAAAPGRNVAAKAGLNRSILAQAHRETRQMLAYKCLRHGGELRAVPAPYTSQKCSCCGHTAPENRPSQALFRCVKCGAQKHADQNASENILADGLSAPAHGGIGHKAPDEVRTHRRRDSVSFAHTVSSVGIPALHRSRKAKTLDREEVKISGRVGS
jgi:putative transposase